MYPQNDEELKLVYNLFMMGVSAIVAVLVHPVVGLGVVAAWVVFWHYALYYIPYRYPQLTEEDEAAIAMRRYFETDKQKGLEGLKRRVEELEKEAKSG